MSQEIINKINGFKTYKYDSQNQKVVNLKNSEETDIEEFLIIQNLLDNNKVSYQFEKNFQIQIIRNR